MLQTLLGHKTATLTPDRYGHLFPDDLGRIADAFDAVTESTADALRTAAGLRAVPSGQMASELRFRVPPVGLEPTLGGSENAQPDRPGRGGAVRHRVRHLKPLTQ